MSTVDSSAPSSAALAIRTGTAPTRTRGLDDLDDADAVFVGRTFTETSIPLHVSLLGSSVVAMAGTAAVGFTSALALGVAACVLMAGTGFAGWRRAREVLRIELGISSKDAARIYKATSSWRAQRMRRPRSTEELTEFGRMLIDKARRP